MKIFNFHQPGILWFLLLSLTAETGSGQAVSSHKSITLRTPVPSRSVSTLDDTTAQKLLKKRFVLTKIMPEQLEMESNIPANKLSCANDTAVLPADLTDFRQDFKLTKTYSPPQVPKLNPDSTRHTTRFEMEFGSYRFTRVQANHWQTGTHYRLNFAGNYQHRDGQFENSQYQRWQIALFGEVNWLSQHSLGIGVNYRTDKYGLWASPTLQRDWQQLDWQTNAKGHLTPTFDYQVLFQQSLAPLENEIDFSPNFALQKTNRELNRRLTTNLTYQIHDWKFEINSELLLNRRQRPVVWIQPVPPDQMTADSDNLFLTQELKISRLFGRRATVEMGLKDEFYDLAVPASKKNQLVPLVRLNWNLSNTWQFFTSYRSGLRFHTRQELLALNPFFDLSANFYPLENQKHAIDLGTEWRPFDLAQLRLTMQYRETIGYLVWEGDQLSQQGSNSAPSSYLFHLVRLPEVHLAFIKLDLVLGDLKPFQIKSSLILVRSSTQAFDGNNFSIQNTVNLPYFEDASLPIAANWSFAKNWTASINTQYYGPRRFSLINPIRSKSFWLVNAKLNYQVNGFYYYFQGRNLANQNYALWQNYAEPSAEYFFGLEILF